MSRPAAGRAAKERSPLAQETYDILQGLLPALDEANESTSLELLKELKIHLQRLDAEFRRARSNSSAAGAAAAASSSVAASAPRPSAAAASAPRPTAAAGAAASAPRPTAAAGAAADSDDEDDIPFAFRDHHIGQAQQMARIKFQDERVLFMTRRMRNMQKVFELIVKFGAEHDEAEASHGWTKDRAGLTRVEELFELRPSKIPGLLGVFAKVDVKQGTKLQYPGLIVNTPGMQSMNKLFRVSTAWELQLYSESQLDSELQLDSQNKKEEPKMYLIGNPMRMGLQINHAPDDTHTKCRIKQGPARILESPTSSDFVYIEIEEDLDPDEELFTNYGGAFFDQQMGDERREDRAPEPEVPTCDRCMLRVTPMPKRHYYPRQCSHAKCNNTRHEDCFIKGVDSTKRPWKCDEHTPRDAEFFVEQSMKELYAAEPYPHNYSTRAQAARAAAAAASEIPYSRTASE